jgi:hypothetical protein
MQDRRPDWLLRAIFFYRSGFSMFLPDKKIHGLVLELSG